MQRKMIGLITVLSMLTAGLCFPAYASEEVYEVYGGAAYIMSFDAVNPGDTPIAVSVKDSDGNVLGSVEVGKTSQSAAVYSAPIVMPPASDPYGKVRVSVSFDPDESAVSYFSLIRASEDILNCAVDSSGGLTVRGNIDGARSGTLEIYILKDAEEYEFNNSAAVIKHEKISLSANSTYSYTADLTSLESYRTNITVLLRGLSSFGYETDGAAMHIIYENALLKDILIKKMTAASSANEIKAIMEGGGDAGDIYEVLGIENLSILNEFDDLGFLYHSLYQNKLKITADNFASMTESFCVFNALELGKATDDALVGYFDEYAEALGLCGEEFTPYSTTYQSQTDSVKRSVAAALQNKSIKDHEDFLRKFANAALQQAMHSVSNYTEIISVIDANSAYLGVSDLKKLTAQQQQELAEFAITTDDVAKIKDKEKVLLNSSEGGSGGGNGGGNKGGNSGGGSGGTGSGGYGGNVSFAYSRDEMSNDDGKALPFYDLNSAQWAVEYINDMAKRGIINGYADGSFRPEAAITRAEFAKIAASAFSLTDSGASSSFEDVPADDWCYQYVSSLNKLGVIRGTSEVLFGKDELISRQDMAVILHRIMQYKDMEEPESKPSFADTDEISDYALDSVGSMQSMGIISGTDENCFDPHGCTTRAQAAKVVSLLMQRAGI